LIAYVNANFGNFNAISLEEIAKWTMCLKIVQAGEALLEHQQSKLGQNQTNWQLSNQA